MNFKPLFEAPGYKPEQRKSEPHPTPPKVAESRLLHRKGKTVKNADGRIIGRKGEWVKTPRHTLMSGRSSASAKGYSRFVTMQGASDRAIDCPVVPTVEVNPGPVPARSHVEHRRRLKRGA